MLERARSFPAGVRHGFTTRHGGVSEGSFASMNVGVRWGDAPENVEENLRRVAKAAELTREHLVRVRQVHGADVVAARDVAEGVEADAVWTHREHGNLLVPTVTTADCVPVLLVDAEGHACAAIHSGWRGTVSGVVPATLEVLRGAGVHPERVHAAIGPCIEQAAFEVGEEVAEQFDARFVSRDFGPKPHVDLVAVVREQLIELGVIAQNVERVGGCTHADPSRYFSYRRDGAGTGQMLSFVALS